MAGKDIETVTMPRVSRRVLPCLFALYIFAFLDRTNVSIAALQMNSDLRLSPAAFGFGAGLFFLGYAVFEVPSNLILVRVGARRWFARIAITWGLLACSMMWVRSPIQFYSVRFLLGVAEAGLFPGVIYYLSHWFPESYRARAIAGFSVALPLSQAFGGPIGGALLGLGGIAHLSGWQWLFLVEGVPSVLIGIICLIYLPERPDTSNWLSTEQRAWLSTRINREQQRVLASDTLSHALANPLVWVLAVPYFVLNAVGYGYNFWAPTLVHEALGTSNFATGLIFGIISLITAVFYVVSAYLSDRWDARCSGAALGFALQFAGCFGLGILPNPLLRLVALTLIPIGSMVTVAPFWCLPTRFLKGTAAAAGIALISAIGSSGGFFGPTIIGFFRDRTGSNTGAFLGFSGLALVGSALCLVLRRTSAFRPGQFPARAESSAPTR